jgi:hypothetical protein
MDSVEVRIETDSVGVTAYVACASSLRPELTDTLASRFQLAPSEPAALILPLADEAQAAKITAQICLFPSSGGEAGPTVLMQARVQAMVHLGVEELPEFVMGAQKRAFSLYTEGSKEVECRGVVLLMLQAGANGLTARGWADPGLRIEEVEEGTSSVGFAVNGHALALRITVRLTSQP